ncbi:Ricin-type beta-trefoil lectin domain-containing protein [Streptoalloteichus tenebrarius]|uniref:Ricin-type beta-trefoil lectin domain-containing protein n=1 Tax=Streptoalloteichus tenebrarius (strain ATCC 17920 / DSM 40477 / JCM 4838 / CBS 697.72 / NBRC 16177 / NCIMB 11028 / NRRL B-12390 / A12253. 1 / ISP 5477) TaxID=1933 RepID=A0ABT1HUM5_STRSD|nr:RICIN domain-containing protein [Streptoalloteichus tenebrarius]MCP2259212.1 Ricin-type beta-trefoil lectin domain-containing protein [Streptoalloteichus tenebrarius]
MPRLLRALTAGASVMAASLLVAAPSASAAPLPGGPYTYAALHSGKCLDVFGGSTEDAAKVIQWGCNGGTNQGWYNEKFPDDAIVFINQNSGKCLDILAGSTANNAPVVQKTCSGGDSQRWYLINHGYGVFSFQNKSTGKCLSVVRASQDDGAEVVQANCDLANNQRWQ